MTCEMSRFIFLNEWQFGDDGQKYRKDNDLLIGY